MTVVVVVEVVVVVVVVVVGSRRYRSLLSMPMKSAGSRPPRPKNLSDIPKSTPRSDSMGSRELNLTSYRIQNEF